MQQGKIARLTPNGYGFIAVEGQEKDLFFHASELIDIEYNQLRDDDIVTFEVGHNDKGPHATQVRLASNTNEMPMAA